MLYKSDSPSDATAVANAKPKIWLSSVRPTWMNLAVDLVKHLTMGRIKMCLGPQRRQVMDPSGSAASVASSGQVLFVSSPDTGGSIHNQLPSTGLLVPNQLMELFHTVSVLLPLKTTKLVPSHKPLRKMPNCSMSLPARRCQRSELSASAQV